MKIAQGAAADTPRNWLGYHEYSDTDLYAMFAALDSTNLYLMVEMPHIDDVDTIIMHHPRLNIGTPGLFVTNAEGKFGYTADILFSFADKGIKRDIYFQKSVSANMWAAVDANGNFGGKTGVDMSKYNYIDIKATKKMTSYQITIPLASLGIDKSYLETTGIEAAVFSTYGESTMDILPWSPSMIDNASKPYSKDTSTSSEKEDYDPLTMKLARIGKL